MTRALPLLVFALSSAFSAFSQGPQQSLKTPVIVNRTYVKNQTTFLGSLTNPIPLFTPTHDGLYRASIFIQATGEPSANCSYCAQAQIVYAPGAQTGGAIFLDNTVQPFTGVAGQPIGFYTSPFNAGGTFQPYDLVIVIEEL